MNDTQKKVLGVVAVVFVWMGLCPPWTEITQRRHSNSSSIGLYNVLSAPVLSTTESSAGFYWLFAPPQASSQHGVSYRIDLSQLTIQWVVLAVVAAVSFFLAAGRPSAPSPANNSE